MSFFAASGWPEPQAPARRPALAGAPFVAVAGIAQATGGAVAARTRYTLLGKPLGWTTGWTIVLVVWLVAAAALGAARVSMGHMAVLTPHELAAVRAVREVKLGTGATNQDVLHYLTTHDPSLMGKLLGATPRGAPTWYAFNRPWEHRVYVTWELPERGLLLSWTVEDGKVRADAETRLELTKAAAAMAQPAARGTLPAVPGVVPSIPPDLEDTPAP